GDVNFDVISPFIRGNEFGLQLSLLANLGPGLGATLTIEWDYTVSKSGRPSIHDAFLQLDGNTGGDGVNMVNETVHTDGTFIDTLHLGGPGTTPLPFDDLLGRLNVSNVNLLLTREGPATTSLLINVFSIVNTPHEPPGPLFPDVPASPFDVVPGPVVGAGLP